MRTLNLLSIIFLAGIGFTSCVSMKQFKDLQIQYDDCNTDNERLKKDNEGLQVLTREQAVTLDNLKKTVAGMVVDTLRLSSELADLTRDYDRITRQYNALSESQDAIMKGSARETTRLLRQLQTTQEEMQQTEDHLKDLEKNLDEKKRNLEVLQMELDRRNARMLELEKILSRKDSTVNSLKQKVTTALLGFENEGLSVKILNGKVYVSLEEKLLFKSGSTEVDPKGVSAIKKLAKVLEQNPDINITIEGHTDDVPYITSSAVKDNWDLSVKRATAIVRILLDGASIDPKRLTASGRSQYLPVDAAKTAEARQKNRRTEIILTPKLDELLNILNNN
jgi:chemotaxis protein MotB